MLQEADSFSFDGIIWLFDTVSVVEELQLPGSIHAKVAERGQDNDYCGEWGASANMEMCFTTLCHAFRELPFIPFS